MFKNYLKSLYNRKMMSITTLDLEQLHNKLRSKISPYTANRVLTLIKHMYSKAHAWGYPEQYKNPAVGIKMFKEKSRDRFLHSDEVQRFFTELYTEPNKRFRNFILLSLFVGQRKMNMLSIRWSDVDMQNGFIYFPDTKNGESQRIPLTKYSLAVLEDMRKDSSTGYLFYSETSKSGHIEDFHRPWYALLKRANIENFRFHDLRRTFGSYQAINGASLQIIGKSLGHKSSAATLVYSRLSVDPIRESMEQGTGLMIETAKASLK
jgi:integrase